MSLDADLIVDRRRLRRKLTFWRVLAIVVIVIGLAGTAAIASNRAGLFGVRPYIARVTISGLIRGDQERVRALDLLGNSSLARAVIVHVDSPGGTTAGSEQLFNSLSRLREKKPLVVVVDSMAASGGYITALAADHIVAQQTSLGRLDRRAVPISQCVGAARQDRREGRSGEIDAAQSGARRLRADQP